MGGKDSAHPSGGWGPPRWGALAARTSGTESALHPVPRGACVEVDVKTHQVPHFRLVSLLQVSYPSTLQNSACENDQDIQDFIQKTH